MLTYLVKLPLLWGMKMYRLQENQKDHLARQVGEMVKWEQNEIGRIGQFVSDTFFDIHNQHQNDSRAEALRQLATVLKKQGIWELL